MFPSSSSSTFLYGNWKQASLVHLSDSHDHHHHHIHSKAEENGGIFRILFLFSAEKGDCSLFPIDIVPILPEVMVCHFKYTLLYPRHHACQMCATEETNSSCASDVCVCVWIGNQLSKCYASHTKCGKASNKPVFYVFGINCFIL